MLREGTIEGVFVDEKEARLAKHGCEEVHREVKCTRLSYQHNCLDDVCQVALRTLQVE